MRGGKFTSGLSLKKAPELRGIADMNMVSIQMDRVRSGQPGEDWLRPLERKASRYGKPDLRYVLAIDGTGMFQLRWNIPDALFGQHAVIIDVKTGKGSPTRNPNGLWVGPRRPSQSRVSLRAPSCPACAGSPLCT